jgi:hypothetical protein
LIPSFEQAGRWFLQSGIQEPDGGMARYHLSDNGQNAAVSTEITGYAVSTFMYLHSVTGRPEYLDAGLRAARYLSREAWDRASNAFPFEPAAETAYFFDTGIIVRGLLSAWRATSDTEFQDRAHEATLSLAFDFLGEDVFHPVVSLPEKQLLPYQDRWSRHPGCYQLKSALAWLETREPGGVKLFESVLEYSLATHESFLSGETDREKLMDRLHAYCYFLEGLLAVADRAEVRNPLNSGLDRAAAMFREIAPQFERSDVAAQLLRVRLIAHHSGAVALNESAACEEAARAASFQDLTSASSKVRGGFYFGQKRAVLLPFSNPVSTAFCLQALELWERHRAGRWDFEFSQLI